MTDKTKFIIEFFIVLTLAGLGGWGVVHYANWQILFSILLLMFANNIAQKRTKY